MMLNKHYMNQLNFVLIAVYSPGNEQLPNALKYAQVTIDFSAGSLSA